eukprot:gene3048-3510_t
MSTNANKSTKEARWTPDEIPVESQKEKLVRKSKRDPFIPIGVAGLVAACAYGAYGYKNRGPMSTSRYLMRLRVLAQSAVVGAIMVGVGYAAFNNNEKKG